MQLTEKQRAIRNIIFVAIGLIIIAKFAGLFQIGIACDETAYSGFSWNDGSLSYSGIFGSGQRCGGESSSPLSGSIFTINHNYARWGGNPYFRWAVVQENCEGTDYPCRTEAENNVIYPPEEVVKKYKTPEEYANAATCRVKGSTSYFTNYFGERVDFPKIDYDIQGIRIEWKGSERGFRCVVADDGGIRNKIIDWVYSVYPQKGWVCQPNANRDGPCTILSGMTWLPADALVEFKLKESLCASEWTCGDWKTCIGTKQERSCVDGCGNSKTEEQICYQESVKPRPNWLKIIDSFKDWIKDIFSLFFSIAGATEVQPGTQQTYTASIVLDTSVDSDYADGTFSVRYGSMALINRLGEIKDKKEWKEINREYNDTWTILLPSQLDNFAIVSTIVEYTGVYNLNTNKWEFDSGRVIKKEAINLKTKVTIPDKPKPLWDKIAQWFIGIQSWWKGLFK